MFVIMLILASCTDQLDQPDMGEVMEGYAIQAPTNESDSQIEPLRHNDTRLEAGITRLLGEVLYDFMDWSKAIVYVVETKTGRLKADVSLKWRGGKWVPFTDTYDQEQSTMMCGPTYLALLSSGKVTPGSMFDTKSGVYGDVRDHNWRRGGFGEISLERALCVWSQVTFAMGKDYVYRGNEVVYETLVRAYLADNPNKAMGILTFYNAIANNGCMVKIVSEGEDGIVLQEQIAEPEHIKALQVGLEHAVSEGLYRKASNDKVKVSACGRVFITKGNHRRMELCGYFPSEDPQYTIMVVLEKEGLPASAGSMCGPILSNTIDLLVNLYGVQKSAED